MKQFIAIPALLILTGTAQAEPPTTPVDLLAVPITALNDGCGKDHLRWASAAIRPGALEFGIGNGNITSTNGMTAAGLNFDIGYFPWRETEILAGFQLAADKFVTTYNPSLGARFYIPGFSKKDAVRPFAEAIVGETFSNRMSDLFTWRAEVGFDYFVSHRLSITPGVFYQQQSASNFTQDTWGLEFDLNFWYSTHHHHHTPANDVNAVH